MKGQKQNLSNMISKLKETWTALNLNLIQSIFHPNQLHSRCHLPKGVTEYLYKGLKNLKDKYKKHGENELYTNNYKPGEVALGWSK